MIGKISGKGQCTSFLRVRTSIQNMQRLEKQGPLGQKKMQQNK